MNTTLDDNAWADRPPLTALGDLDWLNAALFTEKTLSFGRSGTASWVGLPTRGPLRRLVPTAARQAAAAFDNRHDAMSRQRAVAGDLTAKIFGSGALKAAPRRVSGAGSVVFEDATKSVIAATARALDQSIADAAITLGPRRYNRKPVVQLLAGDASTVGYLKVGVDSLTSSMVATETAVLERLDPDPEGVLRVPSVQWSGDWNNQQVLCIDPVRPAGSIEPADTERLVAVAKAVVEASGGAQQVALSETGSLLRLHAAIDGAEIPESVTTVVEQLSKLDGDRPVSVGRWHGDFSPWNMMSDPSATALIDWEFSGDGAPLGADLLHNQVMVATHLRDVRIEVVLRRLNLEAYNLSMLSDVGVSTADHALHLMLYLCELIGRDIELEKQGHITTGFGTAAAAAASHLIAEHFQ